MSDFRALFSSPVAIMTVGPVGIFLPIHAMEDLIGSYSLSASLSFLQSHFPFWNPTMSSMAVSWKVESDPRQPAQCLMLSYLEAVRTLPRLPRGLGQCSVGKLEGNPRSRLTVPRTLLLLPGQLTVVTETLVLAIGPGFFSFNLLNAR
ncbi:hypothetical protein BDV28DRAFT_131933 [Aspergillus coremiiformis]|uniref:Uncharacterized protein n=1 Tax=Aspergillus coremiiformis TaxID=138285 RepID=A0A5N6Z8S8_9EURO|nr:hypothetical protein BDV28DRAFT_131933 [Aspergillus coremiiformis]